MKSMVVVASMLMASMVFAQGHAAETAAPAEPTKAEVKMDKKTAKAECLKEDAKLKGKKLAECVKGKLHH